jgi:hypothetical protein
MKPIQMATLGLLLLPLLAAGCTNFDVVFVNDTPTDVQVSLVGPGQIKPNPSTLPVSKSGGQALFTVTVPKSKLPANYTWQAGTNSGSLVVQTDSPKRRLVNIGTGKEAPGEGQSSNHTSP